MNARIVFIGGLCVCGVAYLSLHLFLDPAPEYVRVASTQHELVIEGLVYEHQSVFLEEEQVLDRRIPLTNTRYHLFPERDIFTPPLTASFLPSIEAPLLYRWDEKLGYWEKISSVEQGTAYQYATLTQGGVYAFGAPLFIEIPTFVDVIEALRTRLPEHTVAYTVRLVATPAEGVPILLDTFLESGGCGGIPQKGLDHFLAQDERVVHVLVNDVLTEVTFNFLMDIETDTPGCSADMPMQAFL